MRSIPLKAASVFLCLCLLLPMPSVHADAKSVMGDMLKIAGAQVILAKLGPLLGLGPKKSDEEKAKEKKEKEKKKEEKKEQKEMAKAEKEKAKEDKVTHIELVQQWAEKGDVQAQCILSYAYLTGQRVPKDRNMAIIWQNKAADQNIPLVKNFLPLKYNQKVVPIEQLFSLAGRRSHAGQYVEQNVKDAVRWSTLGAEEKDPTAIAYMGSAYYTGRGVAQDYKKALACANSTKHDPLSLQVLVDAYLMGNGVEKDPDKSRYYAQYLKLVVNKKRDKEQEKLLKKFEKEIKAGDLYGIVR